MAESVSTFHTLEIFMLYLEPFRSFVKFLNGTLNRTLKNLEPLTNKQFKIFYLF